MTRRDAFVIVDNSKERFVGVDVNNVKVHAFSSHCRVAKARQRCTVVRCCTAAEQELFSPGVEAAAEYVFASYVRSGMTIGVGASGPACRALLGLIAKQLHQGGPVQNVRVVPMSNVAATEAAFHGIPLTTLEACPELDLAVDYVDEVDENEGTLPVVRGRYAEPVQPNIVKERATIESAKLFIAFAEETAVVPKLRGVLPVAVCGDYWESIAEELDDIFIGDASIWRRPENGSAPPFGGDNPFLTAEGDNILDVKFEGEFTEPYKNLDEWIMEIPGVRCHGLYRNTAYAVVVVEKEDYRTISPFLKFSDE